MSSTNMLVELAKGNSGAMRFLVELNAYATNPDFKDRIKKVFFKILDSKSIRGTNLYVLYNDLCDNDILKVEILVNNCPQDILEDACSRQDYSGRELVAQYFK